MDLKLVVRLDKKLTKGITIVEELGKFFMQCMLGWVIGEMNHLSLRQLSIVHIHILLVLKLNHR